MTRCTILLAFGILLLPFSGSATTIIPFKHLAELYLASDEVVLVKAGNPYITEVNGCFHNDCDFQVLTALKGQLPLDTFITLRQLSYYDQWGRFDIAGDFIPKPDYYYLIFLDQYDGGWRPMMLSYYIFEQSGLTGNGDDDFYLVPVDESQTIGVFPRPDGIKPEPLASYKRDPLLQLLRQYNLNPNLPWDAGAVQVNLPAAQPGAASDRALPAGCDFDQGGGKSRWKIPVINMYYDVTNAPADVTDRFSSTLSILNTEYPGLDLINAGSTDFAPDCSDGSVAGTDFITFANNSLSGNQSVLLFFDDPCNQLTNIVGCAGILGIGGGYMLSTTHTFKGEIWKDAAWGYVVINNNVRSCLTETNYDRLLSHEMTHSFKMDHLDPVLYPGNNMNPSCCNAINVKDRECMNYVYGAALPVDLLAFDVQEENRQVRIRWSTAQEQHNDFFSVEKSADGLQFGPLSKVNASVSGQAATYEVIDAQPFAGLNYYRLLQQDLDGTITVLGLRAIDFQGNPVRYRVAPNPVRDNSLILLSGSAELQFESLEILDPTGRILLRQPGYQTGAGNPVELSVAGLPAGVYWLKIMEGGQAETIRFIRN